MAGKKIGVRVKKAKTAVRTKSGTTRVRTGTNVGGLDSHALAWRRLLLDPCGAPMVPGCYQGNGTGNYTRRRIVNNLPATDTSGVFVFQPGTNTRWSFSSSTGSNVSFSSAAVMYNDAALGAGTPTATVRALASCLKVRYSGSESARSGFVALYSGPAFFSPSVGTGLPVSGLYSIMPQVLRTGEVIHEVKWAPSLADGNFNSQGYDPECNCIVFAFDGIPAGSLQFEVTTIYEYEGGVAGYDGIVTTSLPTPSKNSINHVLQSLGPTLNWAYSNVAVPVIGAARKAIVGAANSAVNNLTSNAAMYLAAI